MLINSVSVRLEVIVTGHQEGVSNDTKLCLWLFKGLLICASQINIWWSYVERNWYLVPLVGPTLSTTLLGLNYINFFISLKSQGQRVFLGCWLITRNSSIKFH